MMFNAGETTVRAEPQPHVLHGLLAAANQGNICARVSSSRTGREVFLEASIAQNIHGHQSCPLQPKPPPRKRETTRTFDAGIWKACAIMARVPKMAWVEVCTTALPPSHQHTTACGSMG